MAVTATSATGERDWGRNMSTSGTRVITWAANSSSSDSSVSYFRNKTISSSLKKSIHIKDKDGLEQSLDLQVTTKADAPMVVKVERQIANNAILSRTVVSGTVIATKDDGSIEANYSNLKISLNSDVCKMARP